MADDLTTVTGALPYGQRTPMPPLPPPVSILAALTCLRCQATHVILRSRRETVPQAMQDAVQWLKIHIEQRHPA